MEDDEFIFLIELLKIICQQDADGRTVKETINTLFEHYERELTEDQKIRIKNEIQ